MGEEKLRKTYSLTIGFSINTILNRKVYSFKEENQIIPKPQPSQPPFHSYSKFQPQ